MTPAPRSREQRRRETEHRLENDVDVWVASASRDGVPHLTPLSFEWDGETLLLATSTTSPTGRNLAASATVRIGLGHTRDVTLIHGDVEVLAIDAVPDERCRLFAARTGFDPRREDSPYSWFLVTPRRVLAWGEENELADRVLMRDSRWLT